ncbi:hypothetical protein GH714_002023 [Hevea brasiliensis]|uniref:BTB domain-containing protein n=1 Tax=Hevea brasiliensis TaxID=3981 RepID=A0A6A6N229_HEVBR|nr:hypothetical protein GH714_002023 [Hevea brasiliensis]
MDKTGVEKPCRFGDQSTSDIIIRLRNCNGRPEIFYLHSSVLVNKSKFFADLLSNPDSGTCVELHCSAFNYDHHVNFLRLLYLPVDSLLDSLDSVKSTVGILEVSVAFSCEEITKSCIQYLEAVPWEDKEEEEILKMVSKLAVRFATSIGGSCPPFGDELKISAQEQVEYMLGEDEDMPLVRADDEVKSVVKVGLSKVFSSFEKQLSSLLLESDLISETAEAKILQSVADLQWMCNILPKLDLMKDFVINWADISGKVLGIIEDKKLDYVMWGLKLKMIEVTAKMRPLLDSKCNGDSSFPYKMDEDLCQSIEGAIVSLILALPSNDQANILADWMNADQVTYPDLSEAFEVWCYRTKSAKRRLVEDLDRVGSSSAFDLSL